MSQVLVEQRKNSRTRPDLPQGLKLLAPDGSGEARVLAAELVDASEAGIGVKTYVPLPIGTSVAVEGALSDPGYSLNLKGRARVVHLQREGETFRLGLAFEDMAYRRATAKRGGQQSDCRDT